MNGIKLQTGDLFASSNPDGIGTIINFIQRLQAHDGEATYGHVGIIKDSNGTTLEATGHIKNQNIFDAYAGQKVLIARYTGPLVMSQLQSIALLEQNHLGQIYPYWRLPLYIIPPLARYISYKGHWLVCGGLTAKHEYNIGARHRHYAGTSPDTLVDEWIRWRHFEIIYEGKI